MNHLRLFLIFSFIVVSAYTFVTIALHGPNFFPVFAGEIAAFSWSGQFNVDFLFFLMFGGLWIAWRHRFSAIGCVFGFLIFVGGIPYLSAYLLYHSYRVNGDVRGLLLGQNAGS